jgi:hypothetical protein
MKKVKKDDEDESECRLCPCLVLSGDLRGERERDPPFTLTRSTSPSPPLLDTVLLLLVALLLLLLLCLCSFRGDLAASCLAGWVWNRSGWSPRPQE